MFLFWNPSEHVLLRVDSFRLPCLEMPLLFLTQQSDRHNGHELLHLPFLLHFYSYFLFFCAVLVIVVSCVGEPKTNVHPCR